MGHGCPVRSKKESAVGYPSTIGMIDVDWPGANETLTRRLIGEAISVLTSSSARLLSPTRRPRSRIMLGVSGIADSTSALGVAPEGSEDDAPPDADCCAVAGDARASATQAQWNVVSRMNALLSGFGDELVDRDAVAMVLVIGPDDERCQDHFLGVGLLGVLASLNDGELDAVGERARDQLRIDDHRGALRLRETQHQPLLHRLVIAALDVALGECAPAVQGEVPSGRVQLFRIVVIIDVVGRGRPLDRPVEQLRVADDWAVERSDRTGRMLAVDNEILRRRRIGPDVSIVDDERGQEHT